MWCGAVERNFINFFLVRNPEELHALIRCCLVQFFTIRIAHLDHSCQHYNFELFCFVTKWPRVSRCLAHQLKVLLITKCSIARQQLAASIAESTTWFYFFAMIVTTMLSTCSALHNVTPPCNLSCNALLNQPIRILNIILSSVLLVHSFVRSWQSYCSVPPQFLQLQCYTSKCYYTS